MEGIETCDHQESRPAFSYQGRSNGYYTSLLWEVVLHTMFCCLCSLSWIQSPSVEENAHQHCCYKQGCQYQEKYDDYCSHSTTTYCPTVTITASICCIISTAFIVCSCPITHSSFVVYISITATITCCERGVVHMQAYNSSCITSLNIRYAIHIRKSHPLKGMHD